MLIQEIAPHIFHNEFCDPAPRPTDVVTVFRGRSPLMKPEGGFPTVAELTALGVREEELVYLFAIDDTAYFLLREVPEAVQAALKEETPAVFRAMEPHYLRLAGTTALHLSDWYRANRFCGCCGFPMIRDKRERAMRCPHCNAVVYPRINPAIVVAVRNGDRLLVIRYADRAMTARYALVAGFTEIGESLEGTVRREVMEEVGLHVKNIRYQGSQPWGFAGNEMVGFWADLDGEDKITLETNELSAAVWVERHELQEIQNTIALTQTMIEMFRRGEDPR